MLQELTCDVLMPACSAALCGLERIVDGHFAGEGDRSFAQKHGKRPAPGP